MDSEKEEMNQTDIAALHHFYSRHISNLPDEQALTELFAQVSMKKHQKAVRVVSEPMDPKTKISWRRQCSVYLYHWDCYISHSLPTVCIIFHYFYGTKHISAWHHYTALVCLFDSQQCRETRNMQHSWSQMVEIQVTVSGVHFNLDTLTQMQLPCFWICTLFVWQRFSQTPDNPYLNTSLTSVDFKPSPTKNLYFILLGELGTISSSFSPPSILSCPALVGRKT